MNPSSDGPEIEAEPVTKVARDLTEILRLYDALLTEAVHSANASLDNHSLPGGRAMVELGNVANVEAWNNHQDATERHQRAYTSIEDEDPDDAWPAFQTLGFWSEQWRAEHGAEYGMRPTIASEANYLRHSLNWAWDNEVHFDDFAADVRRARLKLEDIVYDGKRVERTRVVCDKCDDPRRLIKLHAMYDPTGIFDSYKCPGCKAKFDQDDFDRAYAKMLRSGGAEIYVPLVEAVATLNTQGRGVRTVRRWLSPLQPRDKCMECGSEWPAQEFNTCPVEDGEGQKCGGFFTQTWRGDRDAIVGQGYCDVATHRVMVYWPDLWTKHLATRQARMVA